MTVLSVVIALLCLALPLAAGPTTAPAAPSIQALVGQSFQIQNVGQKLLLRPRDANSADGTPLVLYPAESWKCMTWKVRPAGDGVRLINHFTDKTLTPNTAPNEAGETPVQQHAAAKTPTDIEQWRFVPLGDDTYRIEHIKTGQALGANADGNVVVGKWSDSADQKWKLLPKPVKFTG